MKNKIFLAMIIFVLQGSFYCIGQTKQLFMSPPSIVRPKVLWQWQGGLITESGIRKDLTAMAKQGIGGVQIMQMPDQEPWPLTWSYRDFPGKVKVLSDDWFNLVNYAVGVADSLDLTVEMFLCPGWNLAGAPAVTAEQSLKKLSISKTIVKGGELRQIELPPAPINSANWNIAKWHKDYSRLPEFNKYYYKDIAVLALPHLSGRQVIDTAKIINLTDAMRLNGNLTWNPPDGEWEIWRIALVTANFLNHPAPIEALGQEADRMDTAAIRVVFNSIIGRVNREARAKNYHSFIGFETDSYESGYQDFSLDFAGEFKKRNGYDCISWLPAWKDRKIIIGNKQLTERFISDMTRTISVLWQERFFESLKQLARENRLLWKLQPYFDVPLDWRSISQEAQSGSEFWVKDPHILDGTASETAVLYGQNKVWAEAFTSEPYNSAWRNDPQVLKPIADFAYTKGINDFYMHGFPLNSFPDKFQPGFSMGYWGTNLGRFVTWWPYSHAWHTYLSRCNYMLRQGIPVADALVYPGDMEPFPHMIDSKYRLITLTDDVLLKKLFVKDGKLMLPDGQTFQALILKKDRALRPEALLKIKKLVEQGATLIGNPTPLYSASLYNYPKCDDQISSLNKNIWDTHIGNGKVIKYKNIDEVLYEVIGNPDVTGGEMISAHRKLKNGEIFFISNQADSIVHANISFNIAGLKPEWWDPIHGTVKSIANFTQKNGRTTIPLSLCSYGSGFVVFKKSAAILDGKEYFFAKRSIVQTVGGHWDVHFDKQWGGPEHIRFNELKDWSESEDTGVKYYSGTAIYTKEFDAVNTNATIIDLGTVKNIAELTLNGKLLGTVWCSPWRLSIPQHMLRRKGNILQIKVANTWVNRLIGDEQELEDCELVTVNTTGERTGGYKIGVVGKALKDLPDWLINDQTRPTNRKTFTSWRYYDKSAPLQRSGLLGPVTLLKESYD